MPDDEQQDFTRAMPASGSLSQGGAERRKEQDRRQTERQGKYDRRKNRCVNCVHFKTEKSTGKGLCLFHHMEIDAYALACPNFKALQAEPKK